MKISLSTDGGTTFGTVLAASTPNDGSETLAMPNVDASKVRIKIEAVDNYFFDVNDADFALKATPAPQTTITSGTGQRRRSCWSAARSSPTPRRRHAGHLRVHGRREAVPCDATGLKSAVPRRHPPFTVAAVNAAGVADPTPATVSFTVPRDESTFARKGTWNRTKDKRAMFGDYITSRRRGSDLHHPVPATERIVLVIGKVKDGGTARVFLGKRKLGVVKFAGKQKFSQLRTFELPRARKGKLRVVVAQNKPVRIEGVAVVTEPQHRLTGRSRTPGQPCAERDRSARATAARCTTGSSSGSRAASWGTAPPSRAAGRGEPDPGPPGVDRDEKRLEDGQELGAHLAGRRRAGRTAPAPRPRARRPGAVRRSAALWTAKRAALVETPRS